MIAFREIDSNFNQKRQKMFLNTESTFCVEKIGGGWVSQKSYVIVRVGHDKCLCSITRWVGGVKKGQKHAYVIFEWSPSRGRPR